MSAGSLDRERAFKAAGCVVSAVRWFLRTVSSRSRRVLRLSSVRCQPAVARRRSRRTPDRTDLPLMRSDNFLPRALADPGLGIVDAGAPAERRTPVGEGRCGLPCTPTDEKPSWGTISKILVCIWR